MLDGVKIAAAINDEIEPKVQHLARAGLRPGLAAVQVGNNPASEVYVRNKVRTCGKIGLYSEKITPASDISTDGLLDERKDEWNNIYRMLKDCCRPTPWR